MPAAGGTGADGDRRRVGNARGLAVTGLPAPAVLALSYLAGAVPFSQIAARVARRVDLRRVGSGTVSGSALYRVAGFGPLAVAGSLDLAKGAVGPLLAGGDRPVLAALAGAAAVAGHDWSPFVGMAGGRGVGTAMGALLVNAPAGVAVLGAGLAGGRLAGRTSFGCFLSFLALVPVLGAVHGRRGALAGAAVLVPLLAKRVAGNAPPRGPNRRRVYLTRLVHDQDEPPGR
ncbi:MAG TPA: glycerol-3-phosphate acyltransferase [Actinomycetota bacterium]|nr:glycerol-3-phosphate acyltransferase [Actinomycetota bacterium]